MRAATGAVQYYRRYILMYKLYRTFLSRKVLRLGSQAQSKKEWSGERRNISSTKASQQATTLKFDICGSEFRGERWGQNGPNWWNLVGQRLAQFVFFLGA